MSYYIGIDIGTSGTKSLLIDEKGTIHAEAAAEYEVHIPKPMWTEQDPEVWWQATIKTVRSVVKQAKIKAADVKAIGLSGQMHGSVFLDAKKNVIRRALLWNDHAPLPNVMKSRSARVVESNSFRWWPTLH